MVLFEEAGTNVCYERSPSTEDRELFDGCEVVGEGVLTSQRISACPIEPRATIAHFSEGRLTMWLSTQTPHGDKEELVDVLGLAPDAVRVLAPDVGGGFGSKSLSVEDVVIGKLALLTGRPVRWTETRSENLVAMGHGRAMRIEFRIGGGRDGTVTALRLRILGDAGAYPQIGALLPGLTSLMAQRRLQDPPDRHDRSNLSSRTRPPPGRCAERAVPRPPRWWSARSTCLRPPSESTRPRSAGGTSSRRMLFRSRPRRAPTYDSGEYARALALALDRAGYEQLRAEQARRRRAALAASAGSWPEHVCRDHERHLRAGVRRGRDHNRRARRS